MLLPGRAWLTLAIVPAAASSVMFFRASWRTAFLMPIAASACRLATAAIFASSPTSSSAGTPSRRSSRRRGFWLANSSAGLRG